ncbi:MAG: type VI secretion system accessory protein TagJ [Aquisalimonadaceae bacterium]
MTTAQTYYQQGDLIAAIDAIASELRGEPGNGGKRAFYAELLCLRGDLERADRQLDTLLSLEPGAALTIATWRQLIHAAQARQDVFTNGRVPEIVDAPSTRVQGLLEILVALREGRAADAASRARALEEARLPCPAVVNDKPVQDVRDLDDLCAGVLEVLATNGKYFWVDQECVVSLTFHPAERPLDLLWRKASLVLTSGTEGDVFIPAVYATRTLDQAALLGRSTDWDEAGGLVRGIGQRTWLVGDDALPLADIQTLVMAPATVEAV